MRRHILWFLLALFLVPLITAANPIRGESEAEYPAAVREAILRLRCHCSCAHTLNECNHSPAKAEMLQLYQEQGLNEDGLVAWYVKAYAEEARRNGKSTLLLTLPGQGFGRSLEYFIGVSVMLGFAVLWLVIARSKHRAETSSPVLQSALSAEDERRLEEILRRA